MSSTDHTKAAGKSGQRNRKAPPQAQKADRKPEPAKAAKARAAAPVASSHEGANGAAAPVAASPKAAFTPPPAPPVSVAAPVAAAPVRAPAAAPADAAPVSLQTIATAYGDCTKKSLEEARSFVEKLIGARSLDKAIAIQSEFAQHAFQNLVADTQKIYGLYGELAKQTFKPFGGLVAKAAQTAR